MSCEADLAIHRRVELYGDLQLLWQVFKRRRRWVEPPSKPPRHHCHPIFRQRPCTMHSLDWNPPSWRAISDRHPHTRLLCGCHNHVDH